MANSTETFKPENKTISEIFSCDEIYRIPNYQRQYSWNNDQLEELWSDLYASYQEKDDNQDCYFLGSIVVVDRGDGYHELIDGQQRITTLMILLNVLEKHFSNLNEHVNLENNLKTVTIKKIKNSIENSTGNNRLQLQSYRSYDSIFKTTIINRENYENYYKPNRDNMKKDDPTYKYINTAVFFRNKLGELSEIERGEFINYIFYNVNIIKIICSNESFAMKLFQVMNDRGLDLSVSDIVKAAILNKCGLDNPISDTFESNWSTIENFANDNGFKLDDFIIYYEYYKLKQNPKKTVTEELKKIIDSEPIENIVDDIYCFFKSLKEVYSSTKPVIYSLRYIPWKFYVMTAMITAYRVDYPNKDLLFSEIRRYFYVALISGKSLNQIKQTSFNIIAAIANKEDINKIKSIIYNSINKYKMINETFEVLRGNVYGDKYLKPLLLSIEYENREVTNTTFVTIDNELHIDHILPREFSKKSEWNYIVKEQAESKINVLGNMALLLDIKNKEALNDGFENKIRIYKGLDKNGNLVSGVTTFETTRKIIEEYETSHKMWDIESINNRTNYLMQLIMTLLNISEEHIEEYLELEESNSNIQYPTVRTKITKEMIFGLYDITKEIIFNGANRNQIITNYSDNTGMNLSSAIMYVAAIEAMFNGRVYKKQINNFATDYYLNKIKEEFGEERYKLAKNAVELNKEYMSQFILQQS